MLGPRTKTRKENVRNFLDSIQWNKPLLHFKSNENKDETFYKIETEAPLLVMNRTLERKMKVKSILRDVLLFVCFTCCFCFCFEEWGEAIKITNDLKYLNVIIIIIVLNGEISITYIQVVLKRFRYAKYWEKVKRIRRAVRLKLYLK